MRIAWDGEWALDHEQLRGLFDGFDFEEDQGDQEMMGDLLN